MRPYSQISASSHKSSQYKRNTSAHSHWSVVILMCGLWACRHCGQTKMNLPDCGALNGPTARPFATGPAHVVFIQLRGLDSSMVEESEELGILVKCEMGVFRSRTCGRKLLERHMIWMNLSVCFSIIIAAQRQVAFMLCIFIFRDSFSDLVLSVHAGCRLLSGGAFISKGWLSRSLVQTPPFARGRSWAQTFFIYYLLRYALTVTCPCARSYFCSNTCPPRASTNTSVALLVCMYWRKKLTTQRGH